MSLRQKLHTIFWNGIGDTGNASRVPLALPAPAWHHGFGPREPRIDNWLSMCGESIAGL